MEKHKAPYRASEEVAFLTDEEKDVFAIPRRSLRQAKRAYLLPYSGILNIMLLLTLFISWTLQRQSSNEAYIPNEIYCKQFHSFFSSYFNDQLSDIKIAPAQSAVEYQTVVFSHTLRGEKSKFQGSSSDVDAVWDELYNRLFRLCVIRSSHDTKSWPLGFIL